MSAQDPESIEYLPPPSLGHEFGIMFGFIAIMILSIVIFYVWFKRFMAAEAKRERGIVEDYRSKGWIGSDEKVELGREEVVGKES